MESDAVHIATTLGLLLGASLLAGLAAEVVRLPKVTAYLLAGLALGPSVLDVLPHEHLPTLAPLTKLAMALVLFQLGCQFPLDALRRVVRRVLPLSLLEMLAAAVFVAVGMWAIGMDAGQAALLGTLAIATAPATTILVLRETRAEGPVTGSIGVLVTLNNVVAVIAFELMFMAVHLIDGKLSDPPAEVLQRLGLELAGSTALGITAGLATSYLCELLSPGRWLVLLLALCALMLGVAETFGLPYMLAFVAMGVAVVNSSGRADRILKELDHVAGLLTVVFFAVHGAELNLSALAAAGVFGAAYVALRTVGKIGGASLAARLTHQPPNVQRWVGPALLAQAGAAISLSAIATQRDPELGRPLQALILGTVVVFEIAGPLLIRFSVLQAGEVPLALSLHHTSGTAGDALRSVLLRLRSSVGWAPGAPKGDAVAVRDLMRRGPEGIPETADFDQIVSFIEHSHDNTYPVLDESGAVVGLIRYDLLSEAFFDPQLHTLVRAIDLATPADVTLYADEPIDRAVALFRKVGDDCLPVLQRGEPPQLLGVLRRRDLTSLLIRDRTGGSASGGH